MFVVRDDADTLDSGVSIKALPRNVGRFGRMFGLTFRAFREALRSGAPVVHFHDPELMPIGIVLKLCVRPSSMTRMRTTIAPSPRNIIFQPMSVLSPHAVSGFLNG